jgi:hypothetical protein
MTPVTSDIIRLFRASLAECRNANAVDGLQERTYARLAITDGECNMIVLKECDARRAELKRK